MILFKACPRCGGDIDIARSDDIYCVQCSHRPEVVYPGPRIVQEASQEPGSPVSGLDPGAMPHGSVEEHTGGPAGPSPEMRLCGACSPGQAAPAGQQLLPMPHVRPYLQSVDRGRRRSAAVDDILGGIRRLRYSPSAPPEADCAPPSIEPFSAGISMLSHQYTFTNR